MCKLPGVCTFIQEDSFGFFYILFISNSNYNTTLPQTGMFNILCVFPSITIYRAHNIPNNAKWMRKCKYAIYRFLSKHYYRTINTEMARTRDTNILQLLLLPLLLWPLEWQPINLNMIWMFGSDWKLSPSRSLNGIAFLPRKLPFANWPWRCLPCHHSRQTDRQRDTHMPPIHNA